MAVENDTKLYLLTTKAIAYDLYALWMTSTDESQQHEIIRQIMILEDQIGEYERLLGISPTTMEDYPK